MLINPASNVSVPLTVVMRTRSRVPERVTDPPPLQIAPASENAPPTVATQVFPDIFVITQVPCLTFAEVIPDIGNPVLEVLPPKLTVVTKI